MTPAKSLGALILTISLAAFAPSQALTAQEAAQCRAMAQTLPAKQAEVVALQAKQAELAEAADLAGEDWELKEETRNFSADHASAADEAHAVFIAARDEAMRVTADLQSKARMLNGDVSSYNARCAAN